MEKVRKLLNHMSHYHTSKMLVKASIPHILEAKQPSPRFCKDVFRPLLYHFQMRFTTVASKPNYIAVFNPHQTVNLTLKCFVFDFKR